MDIKNYVACDNILGIRTTLSKIGWSFGHPPKEATEEEINKCKIINNAVAIYFVIIILSVVYELVK